MSNQLVTTTQRASALAVMASRYSVEPAKLLETLKNTVFKNATDSQLMALVIVSNEFGLNPFTKQIYAFPDKGGGIVPVVSVDGWIKLMNDQPRFDGIEFEFTEDKGEPVACTATIFVKDRQRPVKVTEYFSECKRNTDPWRTSPRRMLRHKALIQCVRVAFGLSGAYDEDDAQFIASTKPVHAREVRVAEPPVMAKDTPALADAKAAVQSAEQEPEIPPPAQEESEQQPPPAEDQSQEQPEAPQIPSDIGELIALCKNMLNEADVDQEQAVKYLVRKKKTAAGTLLLADVPKSGLTWLVTNLQKVKDEIAAL